MIIRQWTGFYMITASVMKELKTPLIYEDGFILIILLYLERESICLLQTEVMWFYFKIISSCLILSFYKVYMWYILTCNKAIERIN